MNDRRETSDQARTRRRWVTLAEVVAVSGVVISSLTLWNSWQDRRSAESDKAAAVHGEARARARIALTGTVEHGRRIVLKDARFDLTDVVVTLPRALGVAAQTPADSTIDAAWFDAPLLKLTDGGADDRTGRLPVLVTVSYIDGDVPRTARAIYDVVWRTEGHVLRGRTVSLLGFHLRQRGGDAATLDQAWARAKP